MDDDDDPADGRGNGEGRQRSAGTTVLGANHRTLSSTAVRAKIIEESSALEII